MKPSFFHLSIDKIKLNLNWKKHIATMTEIPCICLIICGIMGVSRQTSVHFLHFSEKKYQLHFAKF